MGKSCSPTPEAINRRRSFLYLAGCAGFANPYRLAGGQSESSDSEGIAENAAESEEKSSLILVNLDFLDSLDGYAIPRDSRFLPGESVYVYFQIKGYQVSNDYRVKLQYRLFSGPAP